MEETVIKISDPLVCISDVHLREMDDDRARTLMDALRRIDSAAVEYVILNGDIFDFCFGDSAYYRHKFALLGRQLSELASRGTRVVFVEGNHEFHLKWIGWEGVEFVTQRDYVVQLKSGARIKIMHGDLMKDDPPDRLYGLFRRLVKSELSRVVTKLIPGRWVDALCLRYAVTSRRKDAYRILHHDRILGSARRWLSLGRFDHGLFGHFHVPYAEPGQGADAAKLLLSVDSWDRPNLLVGDGVRFERIWATDLRKPWTREPVRPVNR